MATTDNVTTFPVRPHGALNLKADVGGTLLDRLRQEQPFREAWKRKLRTKDKSVDACATRIVEYALKDGCDDQTIYDLLVTWQRSYKEDPVSEVAWYKGFIAKAREVEANAREAELTALALNAYREGTKHTREEALQSLSALLGVNATTTITSVERYHTDPRSYVIKLGNGSYIECKTQNELRSQEKLAGALLDYASIVMPTFKQAEWNNVLRCIRDCIEDVETSTDSTHLGECKEWLVSYLHRHLRPERVHEGQVRMALEGEAAVLDGEVWFSMDRFRRFIMLSCSERPAKEILAVRLQQIGCEYQQHKPLRPSGRTNTSRSLWRAPQEIAQEAMKTALGMPTATSPTDYAV